MSGKIEEDQGECSQNINNFHNTSQHLQDHYHHQQQLILQMHHHHHHQNDHAFGGAVFHPDLQVPPSVLPWPLPQAHPAFNPVREPDPFLLPPPPPLPPSPYGGFFSRRAPPLQFAYDSGPASDHLRILSDALAAGAAAHPGANATGAPFGLQAELGKMTAQEIMDAKALAASKSHSEAERRRRERINNHLAKLRSLLPSTTKVSKSEECFAYFLAR